MEPLPKCDPAQAFTTRGVELDSSALAGVGLYTTHAKSVNSIVATYENVLIQ